MKAKALVLGLGAAALVATTALPAQAQVVDDFLCSTFSFKCQDPPAPPPPAAAVAPEPAPAAEPVKKAKRAHKKKAKAKVVKAAPDAAEPATAPAPK